MKVTYFQIARWGTATIHWSGTEEELNKFRKWVKDTIPNRHYQISEEPDVEMEEYYKTNVCIQFDLTAWVFACYWWAPQHAPAIGQEWKPSSNIDECKWESNERGIPIETVYFNQKVSLPYDALKRAMNSLNKHFTGKEKIPLDEEISSELKEASYRLHASVEIQLGVDVYPDGCLKIFKV